MPDRYSRPGDPTPRELHDTMEAALLHGDFTVTVSRILDGRKVMAVYCDCGRKLEMLDSLDSGILLWWLADHDDPMFLSPDELERWARQTVRFAAGWPEGLPRLSGG